MESIIFVHPANDYTGSTRVLKDVIESEYSNFNKLVLTINEENGILSSLDNVKIFNIWTPRLNGKRIPILSTTISYIHRVFLLLILCKGNRYFYVNTIVPSYAIIILSLLRKNIIWHIHEILPNNNLKNLIRNKLVNRVVAHYVFVSKFVANSYCLNPKSSYEIKYNKLNKDFVNNIVITPYKERDRKNILMVCSISPFKGIPTYLEIARNMPQYCFNLVLAASQIEVENFKTNNLIPNNCVVFHQMNDLSSIYKSTDLLLNLTDPRLRKETFGMTIIEAFAYGIPAIAPNEGGPCEIISNGINGFLVDVTNKAVVEDAIKEVLDSPERYYHYSNNALSSSYQYIRN